mmetsp:Transcript_53245/g.121349  ORF Transcript_53245/g.121349 Transcript_53245/m.121349 type:complete len:266 (-) Transcript_53245:278-1075(-)
MLSLVEFTGAVSERRDVAKPVLASVRAFLDAGGVQAAAALERLFERFDKRGTGKVTTWDLLDGLFVLGANTGYDEEQAAAYAMSRESVALPELRAAVDQLPQSAGANATAPPTSDEHAAALEAIAALEKKMTVLQRQLLGQGGPPEKAATPALAAPAPSAAPSGSEAVLIESAMTKLIEFIQADKGNAIALSTVFVKQERLDKAAGSSSGGGLPIGKLVAELKTQGVALTEQEGAAFLTRFDKNKDGRLSLKEFTDVIGSNSWRR